MPELSQQIPEAHHAAARRALAGVFGNAAILDLDIAPISGGRSGALVYKVTLADREAVLRIVTQRGPHNDPVRQFAAMQIAADDGIAPRVLYADAASGVAVTAFVDALPWRDAFAAKPALVAALGHNLRRLHDGPAFPPFLDAFGCIDEALAVLRRAGATLPPLLTQHLAWFAGVRDVLQPHCVAGPSHNDLNPGNLLFDGTRSWIIDWESAGSNDPMFDLATMLHWFGLRAESVAALLHGYFHGAPSARDTAKLELMHQVVACYYAIIFLLLTLQQGELPPPLDPDPETLPTLAQAREALATRSDAPVVESAADRVHLALILVRDARRAAARPEFARALEELQGSARCPPCQLGGGSIT